MSQTQHAPLQYPKAPPPEPAKPRHKPGEKPESPDPFSLWGVHDPALFRDPESGLYYVYSTGAIARRSADLITWETIGKVVESPPPESVEWVGDKGIWAPDIIKVGSEYRLYGSNSTWGVRQSCIFLAVSDSPEGPFEPRGCVLKTREPCSPVNAIDANLVRDEETGQLYMVYGSFWGGAHILKLDEATGLAGEDGYGICVSRRPGWMDGAVEGPYIRYNPDTGFYYLFVSYGSLKNDYNIRVGRSRSVTGPYLDPNGRDMTDLDDPRNEIGLMIACGYRFEEGQGFMGPGHNSVLRDADGQWYLACHIREMDFRTPQISTMHIHKMLWTPDGWPVLVPERYAGEVTQPVSRDHLTGEYARIKLAPAVPQGVQNAVPMTLAADGRLTLCSLQGEWELADETTVILRFGPVTETCRVSAAWDWQRGVPTLTLTGKDQYGVAVWGKKL